MLLCMRIVSRIFVRHEQKIQDSELFFIIFKYYSLCVWISSSLLMKMCLLLIKISSCFIKSCSLHAPQVHCFKRVVFERFKNQVTRSKVRQGSQSCANTNSHTMLDTHPQTSKLEKGTNNYVRNIQMLGTNLQTFVCVEKGMKWVQSICNIVNHIANRRFSQKIIKYKLLEKLKYIAYKLGALYKQHLEFS